MRYTSRIELESIAKAGIVNHNGTFEDGTPFIYSRMISSYWVCTKPKGIDIAENLMRDGFWESWITLWISQNVAPGSVCVDAGANYGYYTFFLAQHGCKVISIEANTDLIRYLQKSIELNGSADRVTLLNKAVTNKSWEIIHLNVNENEIGGATILPSEAQKKIPIETIMLNDLLLIQPKIDFIKMDIEGAEESAWEGINKILEYNKQCSVLIEFSPVHYKNTGRDFFSLLQQNYNISFVDLDGSDKPLDDFSFFEKNLNDFSMLVVRNK